MTWKCPECGASSINGSPVIHTKECRYCEKRLIKLRTEVARMS